jgi:hypothetical protein
MHNRYPCNRSCGPLSGQSPASHRDSLGSILCEIMWDSWWIKSHWGRFSPSTSASLANHSTDCSTIIIIIIHHSGLIQYAKYGRRTKWTKVSPHPDKCLKDYKQAVEAHSVVRRRGNKTEREGTATGVNLRG